MTRLMKEGAEKKSALFFVNCAIIKKKKYICEPIIQNRTKWKTQSK